MRPEMLFALVFLIFVSKPACSEQGALLVKQGVVSLIGHTNNASETTLMHGVNIGSVAVRGNFVIGIDQRGQLVYVNLSKKEATLLHTGSGFVSPNWLIPGKLVVAGRSRTDGTDGDAGYWLVDVLREKARCVFDPLEIDFPFAANSVISRDGKLIAFGGTGGNVVVTSVDDWKKHTIPASRR